MTNIDHIPADEQQHYILCECGEYLDMRDLNEVFEHMHFEGMPEAQYSSSKETGEPVEYLTDVKTKIDLN